MSSMPPADAPLPALNIRLQRMANRKRPVFRVVVAQPGAKAGRFLEQLGTYDPVKDSTDCSVALDRLKYWLSVGAEPVGEAEAMIVDLKQRLDAVG